MKRCLALVAGLLIATAGSVYAADLTPAQVASVGFTQNLGASVPLDLAFTDENGQRVALGDYFGQRPVLLSLNYFHCQYLCPIEEDGLINGLNGVRLTLGSDYTLLNVSIDAQESPPEAMLVKARELRGYDRPQDAGGWHLLTGDQSSIDRLTAAVGFRALADPAQDAFAHPLGVVVLTPTGRISRYFGGLDFSATDLQLALVDASSEHIGSVLDRALLICYQYDPLTGRYTPLALNLMRVGGAIGFVMLLGFMAWLWRGEFARGRRA